MHPHILAAYHRLPPAMRSLVATARGVRLRRVRYGRDTESLIATAEARECWDAETWARHQAPRIASWLEDAATQVPYYRAQWQARRQQGDRAPVTVLANWPLLDKQAVRRQPEAFIPDRQSRRRMRPETTSGTTGSPMRLWRSTRAIREFYAIGELRERRWHGVSVRDRWAIFGGQVVAPVSQRRPPFWVWNAALSQLYMSSYHLSAELAPAYLEALGRYRISYLWGYPSAIATLAQHAVRLGVAMPMRVAVGSAEPVLPQQRTLTERAFGCRLAETYGSTELVVAASECGSGRLHLWPEVGVTEVVEDDGRACPAGQVGELVCTGLLNDAMPLIRYRTGDRGALASGDAPCTCGRRLPRLDTVEGRCDDVVVTPAGRVIGRLDPVFKADIPLQEAQIIQDRIDRLRVKVVAAPGYSEATATLIASRIRDRVGDMQILVERVETIPRTPLGKFRAVINELPAAERAAAQAAAPPA